MDSSTSTYWGIAGSTSHQYYGVNSIWVRMDFDVPVDLTKMEIEAYGTISHGPYSNYEKLQYYKNGGWTNVYSGVANHARGRVSRSGTWNEVTAVRFISSMVAKTWGISGTYYVYDFKAFGVPTSQFIDSGLKIRVGGVDVGIAANEDASDSKLKFRKGGVTYGLALVAVGDSMDSGVRVRVDGVTWALRKF